MIRPQKRATRLSRPQSGLRALADRPRLVLRDAASERLRHPVTEEEIENQLAAAEKRERALAERDLRAAIG